MDVAKYRLKISESIPRDYPYLNARVSSKGAQLLDRNDYGSLLKMEANGIARKLEEGQYSREINELGSRLDGTELVETALNRNTSRVLSDIVEMSPENMKRILEVYLRRYDIESLKRILQLKKQGKAFEELESTGFEYTEDKLESLFEKDFNEIIASIQFDRSLIDYSEYLNEDMELKEFECAIDQAYFDELEELADITGNRKLEDFLRNELEYENLRIVLRLKKYDVSTEEIRDRCFNADSSNLVEKCTDAENFEECMKLLEASDWDTGSSRTLEDIEHRLKVSRLRHALKTLRTEPLGLAPIMAFILAKMVEVENLRILVQAKETGVQTEDEIRENLVIAE